VTAERERERERERQIRIFFILFSIKRNCIKNSGKILTVFRKTAEDGLNPPLKSAAAWMALLPSGVWSLVI